MPETNSIKTVIFPKYVGQHYWNIHYEYVLNLFEASGCNVKYDALGELNQTTFFCMIDSHPVIFDFSDSGNGFTGEIPAPTKAIFKFHYKKEHKGRDILSPFAPVSFYDWNQYADLSEKIKYIANKNGRVMNNQRSYGNAIMRRNLVTEMLRRQYGDRADKEITEQFQYWHKINDCLVGVFVPGQNNSMLDRGQFQFMAFGACTISPYLPEVLPFGKQLIPDKHYIQCREDYTDLVEKVRWCEKNGAKCRAIGSRAKKLFQETSTPEKLSQWIFKILNG